MKEKSPIKLRRKPLKNGGCSLYLETYWNGQRTFEFLSLYLIPEKSQSDKTRNRTTIIQAESHRAKRIIELQNGKYGRVVNADKCTCTFAEYTLKVGEEKNNGTRDNFSIVAKRIKRYGDIQLRAVNGEYLKKMAKWMKGEYKAGTITLHFRTTHHVLRMAVKNGLISENPQETRDLKLEKPETRHSNYLTMDELKRMMAVRQVTPLRQRGQNAFFFSCFTGLRRSDVVNLRWADIKTSTDGSKYMEITQQKTKEKVIIPLSENALAFLPTMPKQMKDFAQSRVFVRVTFEVMSAAVKHMEDEAGITHHITYHTSRHTAATLLLEYGADIYTVSKLLGHTDIKTTSIYAEVTNKKRAQAVNAIPKITDFTNSIQEREQEREQEQTGEERKQTGRKKRKI